MITNVTLENFKCFRQLSINPKLVTLLIGPNGTGKSGVMQSLLLLKQSADVGEQLEIDGTFVRFSPSDFVNHSVNPGLSDVGLSISGNWAVEVGRESSLVEFLIGFRYWSDGIPSKAKLGRTRFRYSGVEFDIDSGRPYTPDSQLHLRDPNNPEGMLPYATRRGGLNVFEVLTRPDDYRPFSRFLHETCQAPTRVMENLRMVPAVRGLVRQTYILGPEKIRNISSQHGLSQQEEELSSSLGYSRPEVSKVSNWMEKVTGVAFRTDVVPPQSAMPISVSPSGEVSLVAEGFGTNSLVHLLFELARAVPSSTVLIEEPEIHLHPSAQADLASVMAEEAKTSHKQVIMTTHSEHIAGRLLTMLAERKLSTEDLAIYSFEKDENGVCSAVELELTENGQVLGGLKSFFQVDMDEMRRYVEALRSLE